MKKRILILGASRYYVRSILSAKSMGCEVVVIDKNPKAPGFDFADISIPVDITDIDGAMEIAKKYSINGVIPLNDFGVPTAVAIADMLNLTGISPLSAKLATNKACMRKKWEKTGVPSAEYRIVQSIDEAKAAVKNMNKWPLIVKPADSRGGGSRGVRRVDSIEELEDAFEFAQKFYEDKTVVIEEYLEGSEHSIETITLNNKTHILAISDKEKTPQPYRVDKSVIYPSKYEDRILSEIQEAAIAAVRAIGIQTGPAHVELCYTANGPKLFEIGARCGGGGTPDPIIPFVTGIDMFKEVVRIALNEFPGDLSPKLKRGCVYRFLTPRPGIIRNVTGCEEIKLWPNILDCEVFVQGGDIVRPVMVGADRSGFIIAGGNDREEALELANRAEKGIAFNYKIKMQ